MADTTSTTQFKADISQLKAAMQQAQRQVKLANSEFKAASAGLDDWSDSAEGLQAKITQLNKTVKAQKTQVELANEEWEKTKEVYGENSAEAERAETKLNNYKATLAKTEKELRGYEQDLKDCEDGTGRFADATDDLDDSVENAGDGFTVFKGILSDLISNVIQWGISELKDLASEVIEVGSSFEKSMSNVQSLSGATAEELELLKETAKEYGSTTQFSATEAADALSYMALAGWDAKTSTEALGGVLDLAASSGMDLASASDMVTDYMSAFSMEASESAYFADLLSYAQSNANTTAEGLGEAYKNCAANMNAAGQDVETTTALLSSLANQGLKGSEAGTALTAVMRDMTSKMESGAIAIGETTVKVQDAEGNYRDLTDILKDVENAVDGMGDAEKASALMSTFTSDSIKGLNLILNAGVDSAADFEEQLRNATGTAKDMSKTMNDNLSGDITALNSKLEGIKITIYESMTPALRDAVAQISDVLDTVDWEEKGEQLGEITVKAVEFFSSVIEHADGIKSILTTVGSVLITAFAVQKVLTFSSAIISLWKTFQTLKTVTEAATTAQLLLNAAEAANPIGLVTAAVAGLAAGLIYLASKTKEATTATETLNAWEQNEIDKVYELKDAYEDLQTTRDENIDAINTEYGYYETLADELDTLVDANGEVKEGYEDRVNFIVTTLNDAVGTEMELIDGVIANYQEEKQAIEELIETKKAQAILSATEDSYTQAIQNQNDALQSYMSAQGIYKQNLAELADEEARYNEISGMTAQEYANANNLMVSEATAAEMLKNELTSLTNEMNGTKGAIVESKTAMIQAEKTYTDYQTTIKNYEGLSSAIISGDSKKIATALTELQYNFKTTTTANRSELEQQVVDYQENLRNLQNAIEQGTPGVTQEMVDQATSMVVAAKAELDKLPGEAESSANNAATKYANTFGSDSNKKKVQSKANEVRSSANKGLDPNGDEEKAGENFVIGYVGGIQIKVPDAESAAKGLGNTSTRALSDSIQENSPSKITTTSGENFGQGFINGMNNKTNSVWQTAWNLAKQAINALKSGQQEGSPSKLTFKSGVNFTQGYINGVTSLQKTLVSTVKTLVTSAVKEASKVTDYNFSEAGSNVADSLASNLTKQTNYMINRMTYQNEKKVAEFDKEITRLTNNRDKKVNAIQSKIDKLDKTKDAKSIKKLEKQKAAIEKKYKSLIDTQEKYKSSYQSASSEMISEFTEAVNEYSTQAQDLINSTLNGIGDKFQAKYDELMSKQDALTNKLKDAGDLFEISGAGIMTVNDIREQTKQIREYTDKLQRIKNKVSADLFDKIASYDMKEGNAFMDRLLALSDADLKAYSDAYDEKMSTAEKTAENIYKKDIDQVAKDYQTELNKALADLPKQLETLGNQAMEGFINGLTKNTDYMSKEVKTWVESMVSTFKKQLQIKSPSRVMMEIGDYTGEGLIDGLKGTISNVKKAAQEMAQTVATPLDSMKTDLGTMRTAVRSSNSTGTHTTQVINNYEMNQNNYSPKSLSALETYQARRQQIAMMKAMT